MSVTIGAARLIIDGYRAGVTLKSLENSFKVQTLKSKETQENSADTVDELIKGRRGILKFSLPPNKSNINNYKPGEEKVVDIKTFSLDKSMALHIPQAHLEVDLKIAPTSGNITSIDVTATAVYDEDEGYDFRYEHSQQIPRIPMFLQLGFEYKGELQDTDFLEEDGVYTDMNGVDHLNTGGDRPWIPGDGVPDTDFTEATFKAVMEELINRYTKAESDNRFLQLDGGIMRGDLEMGQNIITLSAADGYEYNIGVSGDNLHIINEDGGGMILGKAAAATTFNRPVSLEQRVSFGDNINFVGPSSQRDIEKNGVPILRMTGNGETILANEIAARDLKVRSSINSATGETLFNINKVHNYGNQGIIAQGDVTALFGQTKVVDWTRALIQAHLEHDKAVELSLSQEDIGIISSRISWIEEQRELQGAKNGRN